MPVEFIKVTPGKMRTVRITDDTRFMGQHLEAGKIVTVEECEAHALVMASKAVFHAEPVKAAK